MNYRSGALHSLAWVVWLAAALVAITATRNPCYLALIHAWLVLVFAALRRSASTTGGMPLPISPLAFTLFVLPLTALFNMLTTHQGRTHLLVLPPLLPLLGGPLTLEALAYGAINGLVLGALFAAFQVLNLALPIRAVIRYVPRAFHSLAVVISISITFVPVTLHQMRQIRDAQAVRGHRLRRIRDWLPLFVPLLVGGLERALLLAEAMTARGFAGGDDAGHNPTTRALLAGGLALLPAGWLLRSVWGQMTPGTLLLAAGVLLVLAALWRAGRRVPHTVYRREHWQAWDGLVIGGALLVMALFLALLPGIDKKALYYMPYPLLRMPRCDPLVALATGGLLLPLARVMSDEV